MNGHEPVTLDQPTAQFWPELVAIAIDIMILVALGSWAFSQAKKAWKGQEVGKPF
jgi:hypothetical protein